MAGTCNSCFMKVLADGLDVYHLQASLCLGCFLVATGCSPRRLWLHVLGIRATNRTVFTDAEALESSEANGVKVRKVVGSNLFAGNNYKTSLCLKTTC